MLRVEEVTTLPRTVPDGLGTEIVEVRFLMPRQQAAALEQAARQRGLTMGQGIRRVRSTGPGAWA